MGAEALAHVLQPLTSVFGDANPNLLVGLGAADDAAVYRLNDTQAIVATVDFFPPIVDDPATFGAIAAANALSDIYAMGGTPLFALNLVAFPDDLDQEILTEILRGGAEKVREAGAIIAGGHTITDDEPKYGLAAIGVAHPDRIFTKGGARDGDALILTKPLGTGVISTAQKNGEDDPAFAARLAAAVASMMTLNAAAAGALASLGADVHACTDITGFGLSGHVLGMCKGSNVRMRIRYDDVPKYAESLELIAQGVATSVTASNLEVVKDLLTFSGSFTEEDKWLVVDPQTSGGLLVSLLADQAPKLVARLRERGNQVAAVIGEVVPSEGKPGLEYIR